MRAKSQYMSVQLADPETAALLGARAGETIRLALAPADVTIVEEIDTYLAGFAPFEFRADAACPVVLVDRDSYQFRTFGSNNAFRRVNVEAGNQTGINEVDPESSLGTYRVIERALGSYISAVVEENATALYQPRLAAARRIRWALDLDREVRFWTLLTTLGNWAVANRTTLLAGFQWGGPAGVGANSDPITDIQTRIEASAQPVSGIWMNPQVGHAFLRHPLVRDHMRQMLGDSAPQPGLVASAGQNQAGVDFVLPGLPPIKIAPAKQLNEVTNALDYVLNDTVVLVTHPVMGAPTSGQEINTCTTFRRRGTSGTGYQSREYFVNERGLEGGTMLVAGHAEDIQIVANNCGGGIFDVIQ